MSLVSGLVERLRIAADEIEESLPPGIEDEGVNLLREAADRIATLEAETAESRALERGYPK